MKTRFVVLSAALGLGFWVPAAAAQQRPHAAAQDRVVSAAGAEGVQDFDVAAARRGFRLFANSDAGGVGMHTTGNFSFAIDNYGPCDAPLSGFCSWNVNPSRGGGATFQFFEVLYFAGAPPTDFLKIRSVAPTAAAAKGGGYTTLMNFALFAGRVEWGPRDRTLGTLFSGVTSTDDGTCRDNTGFSNGFYPTGLPLLASSNCPETWGGGGWLGDRTIPGESWEQVRDADPAGFRWDYWRVSDDLKREGPFMGSNFSTYGETSDHYQDILTAYGAAIPGGTGEATIQGYPLGLVWRFEAFNFGVPALAGVQFWRALVINRSEDVWDAPVDYDSLYLGFAPGTGGAGGGGGQAYSNYYLPHISTGLYHQSNVRGAGGPCTEGSRFPSGAPGCAGSTSDGRGYGNGGNAIVVLKSPIGDLRNKLFTRTPAGAACTVGVDTFCDPTHPLRDDTITFNHGHICGFGGCWASTHNVNDRRSFGMISSTAANVMDGRAPGSLSGSEAFRTFRNAGYPNVIGEFNKYVPGVQGPPAGTWDYNNDGVPDTLFYDTCHSSGCVVTDWDTLPGGHANAYGNVGGVLAAGPFALAAGDTASWFVAFVADADSARTWSAINAATDLYLNFFLAPEAPPVAQVVSTQVVPATDALGNANTQVTLFFGEDPERWVDPFLSKVADDVAAGAYRPELGDLEALNPGLAASLRARAADNLERIEIYKSCDGGNTFTSDNNCTGDPATDELGNPVGFGWEAYRVLDVDAAGGNVANAFTDAVVQGGRTFLYVLVGKSRGASFIVNTSSGPQEVLFAPSIRNTLSRSSTDPNVASVYVPASRLAGFQAASVSFNERGTGTTAPFALAFGENVLPANYRVTFGNRFTVIRDSSLADEVATGTEITADYVVQASPTGNDALVRSLTLTRSGVTVFPVAGSPDSTRIDTVGTAGQADTVIRQVAIFGATDATRVLGFLVASGTTPYFLSTQLTGSAATPTSVFALPDFPGFSITANNAVAGDFNAGGEVALRGPISKERRRTDADTVPRGTVNAAMVQWREQNSDNAASGVGRYRLSWQSDPFGLPDGIVLNLNNPNASGAELQAALAARPAATVGLTDASAATALGVSQGDLVPVKVPFTVRNETFGRDVDVAMVQRLSNTLLLGAGLDTIRVEVQPDQWVPGDVLAFLETVTPDSTIAGNVVLDGSNQPIPATPRLVVTYSEAVLGCDAPRPPGCNPVAANARGETGYVSLFEGDVTEWEYVAGFQPTTVFDFDLIAPVSGSEIASVTDSALTHVRVVPNPFVVFSSYQSQIEDPRLLFTNMPPTGVLRIYTVSGQAVQQVSWTPADLQGAGDLFWDLKTREGIDIASGLYLWVLTAPSNPTDPTSAPVTARGKFVVIRGTTR